MDSRRRLTALHAVPEVQEHICRRLLVKDDREAPILREAYEPLKHRTLNVQRCVDLDGIEPDLAHRDHHWIRSDVGERLEVSLLFVLLPDLPRMEPDCCLDIAQAPREVDGLLRRFGVHANGDHRCDPERLPLLEQFRHVVAEEIEVRMAVRETAHDYLTSATPTVSTILPFAMSWSSSRKTSQPRIGMSRCASTRRPVKRFGPVEK